jgi:hypothetical protein
MKKIIYRLFNNFLMPSRLDKLEKVLLSAIYDGYTFVSISHFLNLARNGKLDSRTRYLMLRHDIDTDVATARAIWQLECRNGLRGSFYFRLQTANIALMKEIHASGAEVGYHFEEIATVAKEKGLKGAINVPLLKKDAGELFCNNLAALRQKSGLPLCGIASHGDFVNRQLGITNFELLTPEIRKSMNIDYEAYDAELVSHLSSRFADMEYPGIWKPGSPLDAIQRGDQVIKLLIHPRQWCSSPLVNAQDDLNRIYEGIRYWAT